jgi:hypothetical protein
VTLAPGDAKLQDDNAKVVHDETQNVFCMGKSVSEPARNPSIALNQKLLALSSTGMQHALHSSIAPN